MTGAGGETFTARIVASVGEIGAAAWDAIAAAEGALADGRPGDPFVSYAFLAALEGSGCASAATGWHPRHVVLEDAAGAIVGLAPGWFKTHSRGEYVFDQGWAEAWTRAGGRYYPKLQVAVPFTPVPGPRLMAAAGTAERRAAIKRGLIAALEAVTVEAGLSSAHVTFPDPGDADLMARAGWAIRHDRQFRFVNRGYRDWDDFAATLLGRKRKQLVRERREANAEVTIRFLRGAEIGEAQWDAFFAFYMDTGSRKWGRPYLDRTFFSTIGATMGDRLLLVLAEAEGRAIAGALNFVGAEALYGRWWGALEERPFLHFELCYHRAVDWAIAHGLGRVEAGAQGEHKLARGYEPVLTRSAHFVVDPGFRAAVDRFLSEERAAVAALIAEERAASPFAGRAEAAATS